MSYLGILGAIASQAASALQIAAGYVLDLALIDDEDAGIINGASRHGAATLNGDAIAGTGAYLEGTSSYISIPDSSDWDKSNTMVFEGYYIFNNPSTTVRPFWGQQEDFDNKWRAGYNNGNLEFYSKQSGSYPLGFAVSWTPMNGVKYHIAFKRSTNDYWWEVNGVQVGSTYTDSDAWTNLSGDFELGKYIDDGSTARYFKGLMSGVKITNNGTLVLDCLKTGLTDNSASAHLLIANGNATWKSGILLDGSGDYVTFADSSDWAFGTQDLTIEGWAKADTDQEQYVMGHDDGSNDPWRLFIFDQTGTRKYNFRANSSAVNLIGSASAGNLGNWVHWAVTREGNDWTLWINGVSDATQTNNITIADIAGSLYVGHTGLASADWDGQIQDVRISVGIARYTTAFTPPTRGTAFTNDEYTVLNAPLTQDAYDRANSIAQRHSPPTLIGNASVSADGLVLDGVLDCAQFSASDDWNNGSSTDFTWQMWVYMESLVDNNGLLTTYTSGTSGWQFYWNSANRIDIWAGGSTYSVNWTPVVDTWYHLRLVRSGSTLTMCVNGSSIGTLTNVDFNNDGGGLTIGATDVAGGGTGPFTGTISDVVMLKGTALPTSYTPPTRGVTFTSDKYTVLNVPFTGNTLDYANPNVKAWLDSSDYQHADADGTPRYDAAGYIGTNGVDEAFDVTIPMPTDLSIFAVVQVAGSQSNPTYGKALCGWQEDSTHYRKLHIHDDRRIIFAWSESSGNYRWYITTNSISVDTLTIVTVTQDANAAPKIYLNGVEETLSIHLTAGTDGLPASQTTFGISKAGVSSDYYLGDDARCVLYPQVLSDADRELAVNALKSRYNIS